MSRPSPVRAYFGMPRSSFWRYLVSFVVAVLTFFAAPTPAPARSLQQERLVGRVIDQTRHTIVGVEIIVNRRESRGITGSGGLFSVNVLPGDSTIAFRRIGYRPSIFAIGSQPSTGDTLLVQLEASAVDLPAVVVSAPATKPIRYAYTTKYDDVFRRQRIGLGTLVTRETIDARLGVSTDQLLDGIAGVHVWNGPPKRLRMARCQQPGGITVFINGVVQNSGQIFKPTRGSTPADMEPEIEVLSRINPGDIEMIEVFRGPSEIPAEFHWNGCAVIAIWTRER